jgi:hypothetical protein
MDKVLTVIYLRDILTRSLCPYFKFQPHIQRVFLLDPKFRYCISVYMQYYALKNKISMNFKQQYISIIITIISVLLYVLHLLFIFKTEHVKLMH